MSQKIKSTNNYCRGEYEERDTIGDIVREQVKVSEYIWLARILNRMHWIAREEIFENEEQKQEFAYY